MKGKDVKSRQGMKGKAGRLIKRGRGGRRRETEEEEKEEKDKRARGMSNAREKSRNLNDPWEKGKNTRKAGTISNKLQIHLGVDYRRISREKVIGSDCYSRGVKYEAQHTKLDRIETRRSKDPSRCR